MLGWLYTFLIGNFRKQEDKCDHVWDLIHEQKIRCEFRGLYTKYTLQCEKCGKLSKFKN